MTHGWRGNTTDEKTSVHLRFIFLSFIFLSDVFVSSESNHGLGAKPAPRIRRIDFITQLEQRSEELVDHAKAFAAKANRPYEYRQGRFRKEQFIQDIIRRDNLTEGLVAVLCTQETCRSIKLAYADKRPRLIFAKRPQRVLYYYFLDRDFGLMLHPAGNLVSLHHPGVREWP